MKQKINTSPDIITMKLKRNGHFPNSRLPVIIYRHACILPKQKNRAATIMEDIFRKNNWSNSWCNGIYEFHHYHSITHECMAVCSGKVKLILGGPKGKTLKLQAGDVIILPAGVAHKASLLSPDFLCVGAYPQGKDYDIKPGNGKGLLVDLKHIKQLAIPLKDPVYGKHGFLKSFWL